MTLRHWLATIRAPLRQPSRRRRLTNRSQIQRLEDRTLLSVVSTFDAVTSQLSIEGDDSDAITITVDANEVMVNGAATGVTAADVALLRVEAGPGDNKVDLSAVSSSSFPALTDVVLDGGEGHDHLIGSSLDDHLDGGPGDDELHGGDGADTVTGQHGNDTLDGGSGNDLLNGGSGDDALFGGDDDDRMLGGRGDDQFSGEDGDDVLRGHSGRDRVIESSDGDFTLTDDHLDGRGHDGFRDQIEEAELSCGDTDNLLDASAFSGATSLHGGAGNDDLRGGHHDDILEGGPGDDRINGAGGRDQLHGGEGNDRLLGGSHDDMLSGGDGDDVLNGQGGVDRLEETGDSDLTLTATHLTGRGSDRHRGIETAHLRGDAGPNILDVSAFDGSTVLEGAGGDDIISGGPRHDIIHGGDGDDEIHGGSGPDRIHGGSGHDRLFGDDGDDRLNGERDDDMLDGGDGDDRLLGGAGEDDIDGGSGHDLLRGHGGDDLLHGGDGDDDLHGGRGRDRGHGGRGRDHVRGGHDDDVLHGDDGEDSLDGGDGDDHVHGGSGNDMLHGGQGDDDLDGEDGHDLLDGDGGHNHFAGGLEVDSDVTFVASLTSTSDPAAHGEAKFEQSLDHDIEFELKIEIEDVQDGSYGIQIDGVTIGQVVVDESGEADLEFSTHPDESLETELPSELPSITTSSVLTVTDGETTVLSGTFEERLDLKLRAPLLPIGDSTTRGRVQFEQEGDDKIEFELRIRLAGPGTYDLLVDTIVIAQITIDDSGELDLEMSADPEDLDELSLPDNFPQIGPGSVIEVDGIALATFA